MGILSRVFVEIVLKVLMSMVVLLKWLVVEFAKSVWNGIFGA